MDDGRWTMDDGRWTMDDGLSPGSPPKWRYNEGGQVKWVASAASARA